MLSYADYGKLIYAGRVGTGMPEKVLKGYRHVNAFGTGDG